MRVAPDHVLFLVDCKIPNEPLRAVSLPHDEGLAATKQLGTYVGHYERDGDALRWRVS